MSRKREILLCRVIEEYLKTGQPIGSEALKMSANMKMSSATIRHHFKIMMKEGLLHQMHISGGRIPTSLAFKTYWREQIDLKSFYSFSSFSHLEKKSEEMQCFVGVYFPSRLRLLELELVNEAFLRLGFSQEKEVFLRYSAPLKRFLDDLVGMELEDIQSFCLQVQAIDVFYALNALSRESYYFFGARHLTSFMQTQRGEKLFFELCKGEIFKRLGNGIYFDETFPKDYLAFVFDGEVEGREAKIIYCGKLDRNYSIL